MSKQRGRPRKYTKESFKKKVNKYFEEKDNEPFTVTGLGIFLNLTRETMCQYEKQEDFSDTIKVAKEKIEDYCVKQAMKGNINTTMAIFNLKNNFGWRDTQHIEQKSEIKHDIDIDIEKMSDEDLEKKIQMAAAALAK